MGALYTAKVRVFGKSFVKEKLLLNFTRFCLLQLYNQDVDPVYPLLRELHKEMDEETALWHTFLYVAYYNLASATIAFSSLPEPFRIKSEHIMLSTGTERRNFRNGSINRHITSLLVLHHHYGTFSSFLQQGFTEDKKRNWRRLQETLQLLWGNGRWAAYKTAEILMKVHDFPLQATDMGNEFSTGPRQGLALFYPSVSGNTKQAIALLDRQGEQLFEEMRKRGVYMGIEQLETMLCDFHAMAEGGYYPGHDIDLLQQQLLKAPLSEELALPIWEARRKVIPHEYLGECNGWNGVDRERKSYYKREGIILGR